jgi:uncharacterized membrane protein
MFSISNTGRTVRGILDWFNGEVQALLGTFTEANKNIICYAVAGILKILAGVGCEHLPELRKLVASSDASLLHEIPTDIGKIAEKLMQRWWTNHGLPYCMQHLEEYNRVSFILMTFVMWGMLNFANY